jgi:hypothetical protein
MRSRPATTTRNTAVAPWTPNAVALGPWWRSTMIASATGMTAAAIRNRRMTCGAPVRSRAAAISREAEYQ